MEDSTTESLLRKKEIPDKKYGVRYPARSSPRRRGAEKNFVSQRAAAFVARVPARERGKANEKTI
ncbi:MAG: hypothetical protein LUG99_08540 [Lachnospiraceae bacterium]|nr:hypothetical protein [Lachnospiraceae bacterium]